MVRCTVILLGVEHPGNLGAVARAMKNFGAKRLLLIDPNCSPEDEEAKSRAKWAQDILSGAEIAGREALDRFDLLLGTTGKNGDDFNLPRVPWTPRQLAERLAELDPEARIGLLFGPEGDGLVNEELKRCDFVVTIPTDYGYPSLNLSHAVAIILYAITESSSSAALLERFPLVKAAEKGQLLRMIDETLEALPFSTQEKRVTQDVLWRRLVGKSMLTQREAKALMGFFRKLKRSAPGPNQ